MLNNNFDEQVLYNKTKQHNNLTKLNQNNNK